MLNKLLTLLIIIELVFLFIISPVSNKKDKYKYSINIYKTSDLSKAKLENYVIGVVAAEMPATFSFEALKAQAVASRTFAMKKIIGSKLDYDNLSSDKGQAYISSKEMKEKWKEKYDEYYKKISDAVLSTKGEVITYNGEIINAYYFSISNGSTEDSSAVFGSADYLVSVESPWDKNYTAYDKTIILSLDDFKNKLNIKSDVLVNDIIKSKTNHVSKIVINNKTYDGIAFRKIFNLRSTDFQIVINNDKVIIETKGYGHGVGMSQYGANSMAESGNTYDEIIRYYYKGVKIETI